MRSNARYIVKYDKDANRAQCVASLKRCNLRPSGAFLPHLGLEVCSIDQLDSEVDLTVNGAIERIDNDVLMQVPQLQDAQTCPDYFQDRYRLDTVHRFWSGKGAKLWILDTGITYRPEFSTHIQRAFDSRNDSIADEHGHGTHVTGIAAARAGRNGFTGVAPYADIYSVKVLGANNIGTWSDVLYGLNKAIEHGADVINISLGSTADVPSMKEAFEYAASQAIICAASGNAGQSVPIFPARYDGVIAVGALGRNGSKASFSNVADVYAYGSSINSTTLKGLYACMSGTSMACPVVSGLACLMVESGIPDIGNKMRQNEIVDIKDSLGIGDVFMPAVFG